ncbi:alpha/beta hydrolase [Acetobacteraceae bacterium H6797]|nr:alpha/beta hydrolase [Acetobacteraceae bacterium H6797]
MARLLAFLLCLWTIPVAAQPVTLAYGPDPLQRLEFHRPSAASGSARPPLVVFIHGGGWRTGDLERGTGAKAGWFTGQGYAFATLNYRLVPEATVAQEAEDVAAAIGLLRREAGRLGFDPDRVALMGHSAGAHLAALVATDPRYAAGAGWPLASIKAISLLDGAGYDVPTQIASAGRMLRRLYLKAFGEDRAQQWRRSPIAHAAAPNGGRFLLHCIAERRDDSCGQSNRFAEALRGAGTTAAVVPVRDSSHRSLNQGIGTPGDGPTREITAFFAQAFAR